jgi:hypothetical protein
MTLPHTEKDLSENFEFLPSPNTKIMPIGLCISGVLLLFFFQFGQHQQSSETILLGWGFIFTGLLGLLLNAGHNKHYRLQITKQVLLYFPGKDSEEKIELPLAEILSVKTQQSAIARFFRYGNITLNTEQAEYFIPDLDRPEEFAALIPPHQPSQE